MVINDTQRECYELVWIIVNFGKGSKVMQTAKKCGVSIIFRNLCLNISENT